MAPELQGPFADMFAEPVISEAYMSVRMDCCLQ